MKTTPPSVTHSNLPEELIRERAYFRWIDLGCPSGDDQAHWFWARAQLAHELDVENGPTLPVRPLSSYSIKNTVATGLSDPTHRFHNRGSAHDARLDVVAGEARQRVRGRHYDSSLRPQQKRPEH